MTVKEQNGTTRRRVLQCMGWGSAGILWTVSGGVPSFTIVSGGAQYNYWGADTTATLTGTANYGNPCSNMGTTSVAITAGVITGITSTATGCAGGSAT